MAHEIAEHTAQYGGDDDADQRIGVVRRGQRVQLTRRQRVADQRGIAEDIGRDAGEQIDRGDNNEKEDRNPDDDRRPNRPNAGTGTLAMIKSAIQAITAP